MTVPKKPASSPLTAPLDALAAAEGAPVVTPVEPQPGNGGNGTFAAPADTTPFVADVTPPPLMPGAPEQPFPEPQVPLRPGRKAPTAPRGQTLAQSVLPDPWRIVLRKVMPNAEESYVGSYTSAMIRNAGGDLESFIRTNLAAWIEPGLNRFRAYLRSPKNEEQPYGDINVMGDPAQPAAAPAAPTGNPVEDYMKLHQRMMQMQQEAEDRARADAQAAAARDQKFMDAMREMQQQKQGGGVSDLMGLMMIMRQMRDEAPRPAVDPMQQQMLFEGILNRSVGPIMQEVAAIRDRVNVPPPPPMLPPTDPMESVAKLIEQLKPKEPPLSALDVLNLVKQLQPPPQESFGLKDVITILPTIREALGVTRMEQELSRSSERLEAMLKQPQRGLTDTLNEVKALREVKDLFEGDNNSGSAIDRIFTPEGFQAASQLIDAIRGGGGGAFSEDEEDDKPIEVNETTKPQKPESKRPKPSDLLAAGTYPDGFQVQVDKLAALGAKEPEDDKGRMKVIIALLNSLKFLAFNDATTWRPPILAMLAHAHDGEKGAVVDYMGAYLKGLANHGKLALPVAEILHKVFTSNIDGAIRYVASKMPGAPTPKPTK